MGALVHGRVLFCRTNLRTDVKFRPSDTSTWINPNALAHQELSPAASIAWSKESIMDRIEKPRPRRPSNFANQGEIPDIDPAANDTVTGREDHLGLAETTPLAGSEINKPIGAHPRSEITGRHDAGSGANETLDGLTSEEEALRAAAEDTPSGRTEDDRDIPVFDRGEMLPKV
jgi:hypothetical protein